MIYFLVYIVSIIVAMTGAFIYCANRNSHVIECMREDGCDDDTCQ